MSEKRLSDLSVSELSDVLSRLSFNKLKTILLENEISGRMLSELSSVEELQSIDDRIKPFEAKGWYKEILVLKERVPVPAFNKLSMECPVCCRVYSEVDPTTLPCGHSLCIDDARALHRCPICNNSISKDFKFAVNYTIRSLVHEEYRNAMVETSDAAKKVEAAEQIVTEIEGVEAVELNNGSLDGSCDAVEENLISEENVIEKVDTVESTVYPPETSDKLEADNRKGKKKKRSKKSKKSNNLPPTSQDGEPFSPVFIAEDFEVSTCYFDVDAYLSLKHASDSGNVYAMGFYALYLLERLKNDGMINAIMDLCMPTLLSLSNDMYANYIIATWQQWRSGDPLDIFTRYQRSAELGFSFARIGLGICYSNGIGIAVNTKGAIEQFNMALEANHDIAYYYIGRLKEKSYGPQLLKKAADLGVVRAMTAYGETLKSVAGTEYLRAAADLGDVDAMMLLSDRVQSPTDSFQWVLQAAICGLKEAAERVIYYYLTQKSANEGRMSGWPGADIPEKVVNIGIGNDENGDCCEAASCFELAAQMKYPAGYYLLGRCYVLGRGVAVDLGEAKRNFSLAVLGGHAEAMVALGKMYEKGQGVEIDLQRAKKLYTQAYAKGYEEAKEDIDRLA